jgi:hypothetical protein
VSKLLTNNNPDDTVPLSPEPRLFFCLVIPVNSFNLILKLFNIGLIRVFFSLTQGMNLLLTAYVVQAAAYHPEE